MRALSHAGDRSRSSSLRSLRGQDASYVEYNFDGPVSHWQLDALMVGRLLYLQATHGMEDTYLASFLVLTVHTSGTSPSCARAAFEIVHAANQAAASESPCQDLFEHAGKEGHRMGQEQLERSNAAILKNLHLVCQKYWKIHVRSETSTLIKYAERFKLGFSDAYRPIERNPLPQCNALHLGYSFKLLRTIMECMPLATAA